MESFPFRFDPRFARFLRAAGIRPQRAEVRIDDHDLEARFGPWLVATTLDNVADASVAGPHRPSKAIGVRLSLSDRGLTFGSNADRTVCIEFHEPVTGIEPAGIVKHPNLSVSVADPEGLARRLRGAS